jgi:putative FmdB family regulatory protein
MPLYEYECEACGRRFEKIQKFSDPPLESCDLCGKGPLRKLMSSPAIQFKGSGWYITDYAKKGSTGASDSGSTDTAAGKSDKGDKGDKAAEKSDTKPAAKTDSSSTKNSSS